MTKKSPSPKSKLKTQPKTIIPTDLELDPDAWPKFEELIKSAAKAGHKPHDAVKKPKGKK